MVYESKYQVIVSSELIVTAWQWYPGANTATAGEVVTKLCAYAPGTTTDPAPETVKAYMATMGSAKRKRSTPLVLYIAAP